MLDLNFNITLWCRPGKSGKALGSTLWRRQVSLYDKAFNSSNPSPVKRLKGYEYVGEHDNLKNFKQ